MYCGTISPPFRESSIYESTTPFYSSPPPSKSTVPTQLENSLDVLQGLPESTMSAGKLYRIRPEGHHQERKGEHGDERQRS
jgi:hypothetical protein